MDLRQIARDSERDLDAPASQTRPLVPAFAVPWLIVTFDELRALPLDHRAGFLVSLIDGRSTVEMIADIAGFDVGEVVATLTRLVQLGAIEFRGPR